MLPDLKSVGSEVRVSYSDRPGSDVFLRVAEVTQYTSVLVIASEKSSPDWLPRIEVKVRVYHDARMAEVVEWCSDRTIPWELCERPGMQARDEKWQWNIFLADLLSHSLSHGMIEVELNA